VGQPGMQHLRASVETGQVRLAELVFGGVEEGVAVAGDGLAEEHGGVGVDGGGGCGGAGVVGAGKDRVEDVGGGARVGGLGADDGVAVGVTDDVEVEVVAVPSSGGCGVEQLPRLAPGQEGVAAGGGDTLGGVDGRCVPQRQICGDVP